MTPYGAIALFETHLLDVNPLLEIVLTQYELDPLQPTSIKF